MVLILIYFTNISTMVLSLKKLLNENNISSFFLFLLYLTLGNNKVWVLPFWKKSMASKIIGIHYQDVLTK